MKTLNVGVYYSGVLLETYKEKSISRPRVRPVKFFSNNIRVEFPRKLREKFPIGTRFRSLVKTAQKTDKKTGKPIGTVYLVSTTSTIQLVSDYSPMEQIYAIPKGDRLYEYIEDKSGIKENLLKNLRKSFSDKKISLKVQKVKVYQRGRAIVTYVTERSKGVCEGCNEPAPFTSMNGNPYLECHHIQQVSKGGPDHPLNVAALCPNCHKRTEHSSDKKSFNKKLLEKVEKIEKKLEKII